MSLKITRQQEKSKNIQDFAGILPDFSDSVIMSDEEEFLENGESVASAIPQRMRKNKPQAHFLVCRNPEFETPGPNRGRRPPPMTPGLANALRMAKHFQEKVPGATL